MKGYIIIILFEIVMCFFIACNDHHDISQTAKVSELDSVDYEIISSALEFFLHRFKTGSYPAADSNLYLREYGTSKAELLLILDSTKIEYLSESGVSEHEKLDTVDSYLTGRLPYENKKKHKVDNSKITAFDTKLLTAEDMDEYNNSLFGAYKYLYKKYPKAWGVIGFSKPSYNMDADKAVIYVEFGKHYKWEEGVYMWLIKDNGKWGVCDTIRLWIS